MKIYGKTNVFEEAQKRVSYVFDEFDKVMVASSGGKDSTVVLELAIAEAQRRGRGPVPVVFIDQEAEWTETVAYQTRCAERSNEIDMWWIQLPLTMENASSYFEGILDCWNPEKEEQWIHPASPHAIKENIFGDYQVKGFGFYKFFDTIYSKIAEGETFAVLYGLRAEESPIRAVTLTSQARYKKVSWASSAGVKGEGHKFAVIYDWSASDIWTGISRHNWDYNKNYDDQFQFGTSPLKMRVSSLAHGIAAVNIQKVIQELDPLLYERIVKRLPGVDTAGKLEREMFNTKLPPAFVSWREYCDYLLDNMVLPENQEKFQKLLGSSTAKKALGNDDFWEFFSTVIFSNDYYGVTLNNYMSAKKMKSYKKERSYERVSKSTDISGGNGKQIRGCK